MKKKILAGVLVCLMAIGCASFAFASGQSELGSFEGEEVSSADERIITIPSDAFQDTQSEVLMVEDRTPQSAPEILQLEDLPTVKVNPEDILEGPIVIMEE